MKKLLALVLALGTLCLAACGPNPPEDTTPSTDAATKTMYLHSSVTQEFGTAVSRTEYVFDDEDRITDIVIYSGEEEVDRYTVESDENGNAVKWYNDQTTMQCSYDSQGRAQGTTVFMDGVQVSATSYVWEGELRTGIVSSGENFESRHTFTYDEGGHLIRQDIYTNGELTGYSICTNDDQGRLLEAVNYLPDGSIGSTITYTYGEGTETRITTLPDGTVTEKVVLQYDENGNLSTSTSYDGEGTVTSKETHIWRAVEVPLDCPRAPI